MGNIKKLALGNGSPSSRLRASRTERPGSSHRRPGQLPALGGRMLPMTLLDRYPRVVVDANSLVGGWVSSASTSRKTFPPKKKSSRDPHRPQRHPPQPRAGIRGCVWARISRRMQPWRRAPRRPRKARKLPKPFGPRNSKFDEDRRQKKRGFSLRAGFPPRSVSEGPEGPGSGEACASISKSLRWSFL